MQSETSDGHQWKVGIVGKPNLIFADYIQGVTVIDKWQVMLLGKIEVFEDLLS